jgi:putative transposase
MPKYRKKILIGLVAVRVRDPIRQIAMEHDLQILSGRVTREHIHVFTPYYPHQNVTKIVRRLKGTSSRVLLQEFSYLWKQLWGWHVWARGYLAVSLGIITDKMVEEYIAEQEDEPIHDDSQFGIDEDEGAAF